MSKVILGYPYSGALYGYISDQMGEGYSHTDSIGSHSYYTTLYGKNYQTFIDATLMLSLIYDEVYLTPADNHWPKSPTTQSRDFHPELGLYADWSSYKGLFNDTQGRVQGFLSDAKINDIMNRLFKIPKAAQEMVLSSILYELNLSRIHRCPIICSAGRKMVIERLIEIDRPATHPTTLNLDKVELITDYMDMTGLLLSPTSLDNLMYVKSEPEVRAYAKDYLAMLESYRAVSKKTTQSALLELARNAIEKEKISTLATGFFNCVGTLCRLAAPALSPVALAGAFASNWSAENARWYALSGVIKKAESKAVLVRNIEDMQRKLTEENQ